MVDKSYLNVKYGNLPTTINMKDVKRLGDLQDKIKAKYGDDIKAFAPTDLQLFKEDGEQINNKMGSN